jgi:hypothetical protein
MKLERENYRAPLQASRITPLDEILKDHVLERAPSTNICVYAATMGVSWFLSFEGSVRMPQTFDN